MSAYLSMTQDNDVNMQIKAVSGEFQTPVASVFNTLMIILLIFSFLFLLFSAPAVMDSDHDDEVASLASSSGNCGARSSHRLPVKDWKTSPRSSPKLKRKSKKDEG